MVEPDEELSNVDGFLMSRGYSNNDSDLALEKCEWEKDFEPPERLFPGQPGYRTSADRSGLDPIDTTMELNYIASQSVFGYLTKFFRWLFRRDSRSD